MPQEAYRLQLRCFLGLVHEQRHLPMLKELLQLYTAVSLRKLASLMDLDEATVRGQLMLLKARPGCWPGACTALGCWRGDLSHVDCVTCAGKGSSDAGTALAAAESDAMHSQVSCNCIITGC